MLALELLLLPVMQVMEHNAFGHFLTNAMDYAGKMPMKAVIFITAAAIAGLSLKYAEALPAMDKNDSATP